VRQANKEGGGYTSQTILYKKGSIFLDAQYKNIKKYNKTKQQKSSGN
jgi:hypothetical protein